MRCANARPDPVPLRYDASLGRWMQRDPVQRWMDPASWNPYVYAGDSPVNSTDPSGANVIEDFVTGTTTFTFCVMYCAGIGTSSGDLYAVSGCCGLYGGATPWSGDVAEEGTTQGWAACAGICVGETGLETGESSNVYGAGASAFWGELTYAYIR